MSSNEALISRLEKLKEITESQTSFDSQQARVILHELKIILIQKGYLSQDADKIDFSERIMYREILELAMIMGVKMQEFGEIQNYFRQLSFYYFENPDLPFSQRMFTLINVNLLMDLAFNKNDEYLVNLTQILASFPKFNSDIKFVLDVERCLQDNSITKLFKLQLNSPSELYDVFLQKVIDRIRRNLAKNVMKKTTRLTIEHLAKLLHFQNETEMYSFIESLDWQITENGEIKQKEEEVKISKSEIDQAKLNNILSYASRFNSLL
ncbi:putative 26S proteasome non-ATPase regulatory subunit 8 [Tritrichomonas foetus]|uniref:26S proteasome non-ATPase regulatory subunit 8 n=1 Tax=Tritrichomonas foetus TaxID=1144522 RepID=A0A1J4K8J7_9EUKA|nr:putative 26S proteasome non-ATPase regulatory subunit 8 [Tritrichomonas foetus]|eukprot:OHT07290.1 putative 26S proteasome non-ATPase regulatory subunit 8 [Tritrichomonas foetus]